VTAPLNSDGISYHTGDGRGRRPVYIAPPAACRDFGLREPDPPHGVAPRSCAAAPPCSRPPRPSPADSSSHPGAIRRDLRRPPAGGSKLCVYTETARGSGRSRGRVRSRSATYCASHPAASGRAKIARPSTAWSGYRSCRGCHASTSETSWTPGPTRSAGLACS